MTDQEITDAAAAHAEEMRGPDYEPATAIDATLHSLARSFVRHGHVEIALDRLNTHLVACFTREQLEAMNPDHPEVTAWFARYAQQHPDSAVHPKRSLTLAEAGFPDV